MVRIGIRRVNVRYDLADDLWTMRCDDCARGGKSSAYWPIDTEFWDPVQGLQRCRACHNTKRRQRDREMMLRDPDFIRARNRRYYYNRRDKVLAQRKRHYAENRERLRARYRASYAVRKARRNVAPDLA